MERKPQIARVKSRLEDAVYDEDHDTDPVTVRVAA